MIKVEIKNGKAVELNPLGKPNHLDYCLYPKNFNGLTSYENDFYKWQKAEAARKVYEIEDEDGDWVKYEDYQRINGEISYWKEVALNPDCICDRTIEIDKCPVHSTGPEK